MQNNSTNLSDSTSDKLDERIQRVENGTLFTSIDRNEPSVQLSLHKLMELFKVPGVSVAVIDNFEIAWAKGYGVTEVGTSNAVKTETLFEAGSVSKPVAAVGALSLVQQGRLLLDEDVNQRLKTWKVPENEFTEQQKVTLRRILSHTAGLTVHGFPGYATDTPVPTIVQVLNGEPPANTAPVRVDMVPGTKWRYSGGGTVIVQQLTVDVTGKQFPQLMRELLFDKVGMNDSTYEQPLPSERHVMAASGTQWNGTTVEGKWHIYPEMAAAGLWTTPSDLAKLAIEIALSKKGMANRILSQSITEEMLSVQTESPTQFLFGSKENPARMGLGFFLGDETRPNLFGHTGDDAGFQAALIMDSVTGQGAVIMTNSEFGSLLYDDLLDNIAHEYSWQNYVPADRPHASTAAILMIVAQEHGIEAAFNQYRIFKNMHLPRFTPDENTLLILGYLLLANNKPEDAIETLKLEIGEYPEYWNGYDSLAEIYAALGENQLAIQSYRRSIELNPENQHAIENIKKLTE